MEKNIIGRKEERKVLLSLSKSKQSEFAVVYGRRRVGKTYLVRELFEGKFAFYHTAISPFEMTDSDLLYRQQLKTFSESLRMYGDYHKEVPSDWFEAFSWLKELLMRKGTGTRQIVFIDELPWMDTPRAGFITAFEHFWNGWGAGCHNLFLIVCGSATTWINDKLLNNTGGLYGRATREIHLSPFTLSETYDYFKSRGLSIDQYDTLAKASQRTHHIDRDARLAFLLIAAREQHSADVVSAIGQIGTQRIERFITGVIQLGKTGNVHLIHDLTAFLLLRFLCFLSPDSSGCLGMTASVGMLA